MKKITTVILGFLSFGALAQQEAGFSMYFFNPVYVNPAYAGSREVLSGSLVHRSQWAGMKDAPTTQALSVHSAIPNSKVGLGLQVYNDNTGPMRNTGLSLTYAYHMKVGANSRLSFGVTGMLNNIKVNWDEINIDDNNDMAFIQNKSSSWVPDASAGIYFYKERFYMGLSSIHLIESKFGLTDAPGSNFAKFSRQYYFTSGIVLPITDKVDFRPSILVKSVKAAPGVGEINACFIFNRKLFLGAGFRSSKRINLAGTDNMLIAIAQYQFSKYLSLGYSFDYYLNRNGSYNSGTHEVMLGWDIFHNKTKMSNPRFF
jgi:type IX secretion system PorP/SprF family membrane protein